MTHAFAIEDYQLDDEEGSVDVPAHVLAEQSLVQEQNSELFRQHVYCELFRGLRSGDQSRFVLVFKENALLSNSQMSLALDAVKEELARWSVVFSVPVDKCDECGGRRVEFEFYAPAHALAVLRRQEFVKILQ